MYIWRGLGAHFVERHSGMSHIVLRSAFHWASGRSFSKLTEVLSMLRPQYLLPMAFLAVPALAETHDAFARWVPNGWKLISQTTGDLNRDGIDDIVLITEATNPSNFKENPALGPRILNLNPRRLIILLNSPSGLKEILSRDDLLPSENEENMGCLADPLANGGLSIERGNLAIELQMWLSCGSYGVTNEKFTFRLQSKYPDNFTAALSLRVTWSPCQFLLVFVE